MDPTERWQPIAPATDEPGQQRAAPDPKKRRQAIAVACVQCRSGKVKCDGLRPRCTRCTELDLPCRFDVAEGVSRAERMKLLKRETMSGRVEEIERLIRALRTGSDDEASALLARLRIGDRLDDIVRELPSLSSTIVSRPPSLTTQDSSGTSTSHMSTDPTIASNDRRGSLYGRDTSAPYSPSLAQHTSWSGSNPAGPSSKSKGKQAALTVDTSRPTFLCLLFDREDYLKGISDSDDEDEDESGVRAAVFIDPRLLNHPAEIAATGASPRPPADLMRSRHPSPKKSRFTRHRALTYLSNRQPMANVIRVHPNLNHSNLFGNMPFSSSVRTNNYPSDIQDAQVENLFLPSWAMMPVSSRADPGSIKDAFQTLFRDTKSLLESGTPVEVVIETHPNILALFDEADYERSGVLSKWAVGMVHSAQLNGTTFTAFASMHLVWNLARWMVSPSPETYEAIPEWLRPTPNQLFMPHITSLDFVPWPALREFAVQIPEMQEHMEYFVDMCINIRCDWFFASEEAFYRNAETGLLDLCELAKTAMRDLTSWSLGPSFRQYVTNADSYVRIRAEEI